MVIHEAGGTLPTYQSVVLARSTYMLSDRIGANWTLVLHMITSRRSCSEVVTCRAPPVSVSASYCPDGFLYFGVPVSAKKSSLREGFPAPAPPMTPAFNVVWEISRVHSAGTKKFLSCMSYPCLASTLRFGARGLDTWI